MAAEWAPDPGLLTAVVDMITAASSPDNDSLQNAYAFFNENCTNPEFIQYLVFTFVHGTHLPLNQRAVAAATTKTVIDKSYSSLPPEIKDRIKSQIVLSLADPTDSLRRSAANVVASMCQDAEHFGDWPELPAGLAASLTSADEPTVDGALRCLVLLTSDIPQAFDEVIEPRPIALLVPELIRLMEHPTNAQIRYNAAQCMCNFIEVPAVVMNEMEPDYLKALGTLMADPSPPVREVVIHSLEGLLESPTGLWDHLEPAFQFILSCMDPAAPPSSSSASSSSGAAAGSGHAAFGGAGMGAVGGGGAAAIDIAAVPWSGTDSVLQAAVGFWSGYAERAMGLVAKKHPIAAVVLPYLPTIVQRLMTFMALTDEDIRASGSSTIDVSDAHIADKESDVAPLSHGGGGAAKGAARGKASGAAGAEDEEAGGEGEEEEEVEEDTGQDPHASGGITTVRKIAAGSLECLAIAYPEQVLATAISEVSARMEAGGDTEAEWRARESGILAFGSLAQGCVRNLAEDLPNVLPHIMACTRDARPFVRATALWALSNYSSFIVEADVTAAQMLEDGEGADGAALTPEMRANAESMRLLEPYVACLAERVGELNKLVQHHAMKAAVDLCNTAIEALQPHLHTLLDAFVAALPHYQLKNRLLLYDGFSALAENLPDDFQTAPCTPELLSSFVQRVQELPEDCFELSVLLGCLYAILGAVKLPLAAEYVGPLFMRASALMRREMQLEAAAADVGAVRGAGASDIRLAVCADIMEVAVDLAGAPAGEAVESVELLDMLQYVCKMPADVIRQSTFALLGTLTTTFPALVAPVASGFLTLAIELLEVSKLRSERNDAAVANIIWASSKLMRLLGHEAEPLAPELLYQLVLVLKIKDLPPTLMSNLAEAMGVMGTLFPAAVGEHMPTFIKKWSSTMAHVSGQEDLYVAYSGYLDAMSVNVAGVNKGIVRILQAFVAYEDPVPEEIAVKMQGAVQALKASMPAAQWRSAMAELDDEETKVLQARFPGI